MCTWRNITPSTCVFITILRHCIGTERTSCDLNTLNSVSIGKLHIFHSAANIAPWVFQWPLFNILSDESWAVVLRLERTLFQSKIKEITGYISNN